MTMTTNEPTHSSAVLNLIDRLMTTIDEAPTADAIIALGEITTHIINEGENVEARMALAVAFCECLQASIDCEPAGNA